MDLKKYEMSEAEFEKFQREKNLDYYKIAAKYYVKPFKIYGNLYYIGDEKVCSHLIDTGEGLIMFDCGFPHITHLLIQAIYELGFNPKDIEYLIISHEHEDHFGAVEELRHLYGCKVLMSKTAQEVFEKNGGSIFADDFRVNFPNMVTKFDLDGVIADGDVISLGNTMIRCVNTPGHSDGCMSFFFQATENGKALNVGYFGGVGFNTLFKKMLQRQGRPLSAREDFLNSLNKVKDENVDIVLGNHPKQNDTLEKRKQMILNPDKNPFVDPAEWRKFCETMSTEFLSFMKRDI